MASTQNNALADGSLFPLRSVLGAPLDYDALLNDDLLDLIGLKDAPQEEKDKLYAKIMETVENRVIARVADQLDDDEMAEVMAQKDKEKLADYFTNKNIDIAKLFVEETLLYKTELVSLVNRDHAA